MHIKAAKRTENIIYAIRNIVSYAKGLEKQGQKITYLNIGDPIQYDFATPDFMIEASTSYMKKGSNWYASSFGIEEARKAIAQAENKKGKTKVQSDDVYVCSGASEAIEIVLTALLNIEDNVLLPIPGYPLYNAVTAKIGTQIKGYSLDPKNNWQPDLDNIRSLIDKNTRALVIINPNNPTGVCYNEETLKGIINICKEHNLVLLSDEIYDGLLFDNRKMIYPGCLSQDVPIISFNGLSKNYLAPGWRMGWMVFQNMTGQDEFIAAIKRIAEARLCSCSPLQGAIVAALQSNNPHLPEVLKKMQRRRDITFERLNAIPRISCVKPEAAFYAMPLVEGIADDESFVKELVRETGVLFVHGSGFGMPKERGAFRVVFLPNEETLHQAFDKLEAFIKKK